MRLSKGAMLPPPGAGDRGDHHLVLGIAPEWKDTLSDEACPVCLALGFKL